MTDATLTLVREARERLAMASKQTKGIEQDGLRALTRMLDAVIADPPRYLLGIVALRERFGL